MSDYSIDMRDVRFNLFDFLDVGSLSRFEHYAEYDAELIADVVEAARDQAMNLLAPLNETGDREGLRVEDGKVRMPEGFKRAYDQYVANGWIGLSHSVDIGGQGMPHTVSAVTQELFCGANLSFLFTPGLTAGSLGLIASFGSDEQKATYIEKMITGEWSGTMALTEPGAGSAVPDLKTMAYPIEGREGFYKMKGQKIFISSGSHDLTDNIVHLALARVDGDPPGHRGISLFIIPERRPTADGKPGEFNDVTLVGIEEKLGIHASPTCQLAFGDNDDCEGWLIGGRGNGLRCMFQMMNEARISVGLQGVGLSGAAYQKAVSYAKERIQGTRIQDSRKENAERVAIIEHPDVRRNLMWMKAVSEGSRALALYTAYCADRMEVAEADNDRKRWSHQLEILTPIVKAWCSDEGFRATEMGIQVMGGYGYIREYGMEQIMRDAKIASLYEGTNGIQALDLLGRKVARGGGVMMMTMLNELNNFIKSQRSEEHFQKEFDALAKGRDAVAGVAMDFGKRMMKGDVAYAALHATPFLQMFGDVLIGWLLLSHAIKAEKLYDQRLRELDVDPMDEEMGQEIAEDAEARYLHGKIATAQFFIHQIMPRVHARRTSIQSDDRSALTAVL